MLKDFIADILKGVFKPLVGLAIPIGMVLFGAGSIGLSDKFDSSVLLWIGMVVALVGLLWGLVVLLWYSGA